MVDKRGVRRGQEVYGADGGRLGRVIQCDDSGFVVEKGLVFTEDRRIGYDEVVSTSADGVHLRLTAEALLPEEEAEPWEPPRDPVGTAGGTDLEPLRAGMAELDEQQRGRSGEALEGRRRWAGARRAALARETRPGGPPASRRGEREKLPPTSTPVSDAEIARHIGEEVEDWEREAAVTPRAPPRAPAARPGTTARAPRAKERRSAARPEGAGPPARSRRREAARWRSEGRSSS